MAQNDMEVIMYKILSYLYECMKAGKTPRQEDFGCDCQMFHIPQRYWEQIMCEMADCGFVRGVTEFTVLGGESVRIEPNIAITLKGREFLRDNSGMQRVRQMLGGAFPVLLDRIIGAII